MLYQLSYRPILLTTYSRNHPFELLETVSEPPGDRRAASEESLGLRSVELGRYILQLRPLST